MKAQVCTCAWYLPAISQAKSDNLEAPGSQGYCSEPSQAAPGSCMGKLPCSFSSQVRSHMLWWLLLNCSVPSVNGHTETADTGSCEGPGLAVQGLPKCAGEKAPSKKALAFPEHSLGTYWARICLTQWKDINPKASQPWVQILTFLACDLWQVTSCPTSWFQSGYPILGRSLVTHVQSRNKI